MFHCDLGMWPFLRDTGEVLCKACAADAGFHEPFTDYPMSRKYAENCVRAQLLDGELTASTIVERISRNLSWNSFDELVYQKRLVLDQRSIPGALRRMIERGEVERKDSGNGSDSLYSLTPKGEAAYWEIPVDQLDEFRQATVETKPTLPDTEPIDEKPDVA